MPYIREDDRERMRYEHPQTAGELNYMFTCLILGYLSNNEYNYEHMNAVVGALESCKLEFYRRVVAPYEETKIKENYDVYNV